MHIFGYILKKYINGSRIINLTYVRSEYNKLIVGYVDADWGNDETTHKNKTDYLFKAIDNYKIT